MIYKQGYDIRFEAAKAIPVFVNDLLVRMVYSIRRLVRYFMDNQDGDRSFGLMWELCEPFSNASVKRMLTVAHGTFCLLDVGDALDQGFIRGAGSFRIDQFLMRLNIVGLGRFTISLYGEANRWLKRYQVQKENFSLRQEKIIISDYIDGLKILLEVYDNEDLLLFTQELKESDMYIEVFEKSALLAEKRNVPKNQIVGLSHYLLPRLAKSESNWINGNEYWYRSSLKLGLVGLVISLITMVLGEVFNLYDWLIGLFIIQISSILGMIYICYRMEKYILKD